MVLSVFSTPMFDDLRRMVARTRAGAPGASIGWGLVVLLAVVGIGIWFGFHPGQSNGDVLVIGASANSTAPESTTVSTSAAPSSTASATSVDDGDDSESAGVPPAGPTVVSNAPTTRASTSAQPVTTRRTATTQRAVTTRRTATTQRAVTTRRTTTTAAPTTRRVTTTAPTTAAPTTRRVTTTAPTTAAPTTAAPTTAAPTTAAPTTTARNNVLEQFCEFFPNHRRCS